MNQPVNNVSEIYPVYDSVIVSQFLHGAEARTPGWYGASIATPVARPMETFASKERHSFFKERTEGNSDLAYCNLQSADQMDFAYRLYSIGVRYWGPISGWEATPDGVDSSGGMSGFTARDPLALNSFLAHWWKTDLPRHCGFEFKVEQDVLAEGGSITFPPGHGVMASGSSWSDPVTPAQLVYPELVTEADQLIQYPQMISIVNQGIPVMGNRFNLKNPIEIPKGALIEAAIILSPYARYVLADVMGPLFYQFQRVPPRAHVRSNGPPVVYEENELTWFGTRYGITVSLIGERLVQQRGQYFAPGASQA